MGKNVLFWNHCSLLRDCCLVFSFSFFFREERFTFDSCILCCAVWAWRIRTAHRVLTRRQGEHLHLQACFSPHHLTCPGLQPACAAACTCIQPCQPGTWQIFSNRDLLVFIIWNAFHPSVPTVLTVPVLFSCWSSVSHLRPRTDF